MTPCDAPTTRSRSVEQPGAYPEAVSSTFFCGYYNNAYRGLWSALSSATPTAGWGPRRRRHGGRFRGKVFKSVGHIALEDEISDFQ